MQNLLSRLQLRHLKLIHSVARHGQLSLAAAELSMTQPAASRRLSETEALVGAPLFIRRPTGMVPTHLGGVLIRHAALLLGQLETAVEEVEAHRDGLAGSVRIGAVTGPAVHYVVPAVQKLKAVAEKADVQVEVAPSADLMEGLLHGDFDIVLCRVPPNVDAGALDLQRGRVEIIRMVTRTSHPLQARKNIRLSELRDLTWVVQRAGMPIRDAIAQAFINRGLPPPGDTVDTSSLLLSLSYLESTDAVAAMTEEVTDLIASEGARWRVLPMREKVILSPYNLIMRRDQVVSPLCGRLHALLMAELSPSRAS